MTTRPRGYTHNPRSYFKAAGVVLFWWVSLCAGLSRADQSLNEELKLPMQCVSGFSPAETGPGLEDAPIEHHIGDLFDAQIHPHMQHWLTAHRWQVSYRLWQQSRRCAFGFKLDSGGVCSVSQLPAEGICQGPQDGFEFLAMHRYLLQSQRALWPGLNQHLSAWKTFPTEQDYPIFLQGQISPWPDAVRRAAAAIDRLSKLPRAQILKRWPSEGAFGQWLQCGTTQGGLAPDNLYGALLSNGTSGGFNNQDASLQSPQDLYIFWRSHAWIDKAWDTYRKALGKTADDPQLQAVLIQQCQIQTTWAEFASGQKLAAPTAASEQSGQFSQGELNPNQAGWVKVLGEIEAATQSRDGRAYFKLNLRLVGVKPIWMTSEAPLVPNTVKLGTRYRFIGYAYKTARLDATGSLQKLLNSDSVLVATSIQSVK